MVVHPRSHRVSRVRRYSGYPWAFFVFAYWTLTISGWLSHAILLTLNVPSWVRTPRNRSLLVWPPPRSLATTSGISVDVFSSSYLDVSVQTVPPAHLFDSVYSSTVLPYWVAPFGNLRIKVYLQLPEAYRSLSRPSSAPDAKAFPLRSL